MSNRDKNAAIADEIYSQSSYSWDGNSRPNINDYVEPWARYANLTESGATAWRKNRYYNDSIRYAKTMLESAISQYDNDVAFWNERDERSYTTPSAQSQRYEDAGYNLGYMYSSVDSGNSAVGYDQNESSYTPNDTSSKSNERAKVVIEAIGTAFDIATKLVKSGINIKKLPHEIINLRSDSSLKGAQMLNEQERIRLSSMEADFRQYLQEHDKDGNSIESLGESIYYSIATISQRLNEELLLEKSYFNQYASKLFENQSVPNGYQNVMNMISNSNLPDWLKGTLEVFTYIFDTAIGNMSQTTIKK